MIAPFPLEVYLAEEGPFECDFFAWMANLDKILIMDNLGKRHIIEVDWCLCKKSGKIVNYLLLHCKLASALWNSIFDLFGFVWVMPRRVKYLHFLEREVW
jgi:hypothetical protein